MKDQFLSEHIRAEDIILGSLGFGEEAHIIEIVRTPEGFKGVAEWSDGGKFEFTNDDEVDELQKWALDILGASCSEASKGG